MRRRFVWWNTCGIDALTEEEYRTRRKRRRERGEIEDIVLVRDIFVPERLANVSLRNLWLAGSQIFGSDRP